MTNENIIHKGQRLGANPNQTALQDMLTKPINDPWSKMPEELLEKVSIVETLIQRGNKYGEFKDHANITQSLKTIFHETLGWVRLEAFQKEALEMIAHKIGRILNGDPNYHDSWHDIVGYAKLVADRLLPKEEEE